MEKRTIVAGGIVLLGLTGVGVAAFGSGAAAAPLQSGTLIVVNKSDSTVSFIDVGSLRVIGTAPTGHAPHEVAVSPDGKLAYVSNYGTSIAPGHSLSVIDLEQRKEVAKIDLGSYRRPHGIVVSRDGQRVYVTCEDSKALVVVDAKERKVSHAIGTDQKISHMVVLTPDETRAYVANIGSGTVTALDLVKREIIRQIKVGSGAEGIDISPDGKMVYAAARAANRLSKIDTAANKVVEHVETDVMPIRVKLTPDGQRVLVSNARSGTLQVFDATTLEQVTSMVIGRAPIGILIEPRGRRAFVARTLDDKVSVVDLSKWEVIGEIQPGDEPDGLGFARDE